MTTQTQIQAAPANGLDINFDAVAADFQMPSLGLFADFVDSLSGQANDNAPVKVAKLDNVPSFQPPAVPGMRM